ncbi:IPT/TIG domain-containing protein [Pseudonocardia alaniniphila]|uniref:IPT/TIG domain-containing protein n=1 Tax=Pseudonocardia alaniniphila TaxID=75291 RepID=A0ABS9TBP6_9PSEU|nr:IPT/TIG domain-containing protein [Pseudonocardia alaniniphila]MCH6165971.1 IPT/TIG domain-containing protein [Pseudonocardia alaniniphila]
MPISPNQGSSAGGTAVVITGTNLANASAVRFGANLGTITANTPTQINVTSPAGHGVVGVTVTTPGGTSNPLSYFYLEPPAKFALSPTSGVEAGGNSVTITGSNLNGATSVTFGANAGTITANNSGSIVVTVPAGTGSVPVTVVTPGGSTNGLSYEYVVAPTVATIDPDSGPTAGGTGVTITGTGLTTTSSVTFGGTPASFVVISPTEVSATTPAGAAGAVDVVVTTTGGSATLEDGFTYVAGPGI